MDKKMKLARKRGEAYLSVAEMYCAAGDLWNAMAALTEASNLSMGPFYLAVRDQIEDLKLKIEARMVGGCGLICPTATPTGKNGVMR